MNEKEKELKEVTSKLTEQNQEILLMLAQGMKIAQQT